MYIEEWILEKLLREERERIERGEWLVLSIPFHRVESERFVMTEQEIRAYEMPITKIITDNSVKVMSEEVDNHFLDAVMYGYGHLHKEKK